MLGAAAGVVGLMLGGCICGLPLPMLLFMFGTPAPRRCASAWTWASSAALKAPCGGGTPGALPGALPLLLLKFAEDAGGEVSCVDGVAAAGPLAAAAVWPVLPVMMATRRLSIWA